MVALTGKITSLHINGISEDEYNAYVWRRIRGRLPSLHTTPLHKDSVGFNCFNFPGLSISKPKEQIEKFQP
ncbi:MAG: hypothetical protein QXW70_00440 [Candidatus Anstonellales archaeon]